MIKDRTILVTGGAGFIGTHLSEALCAQNQVVMLDNFRRDSLRYAPALREHANVRLVKADILDHDAVAEAMRGVDVVIHLAAIAGVSSYYAESLKTLQVNILGTLNVLEQAKIAVAPSPYFAALSMRFWMTRASRRLSANT